MQNISGIEENIEKFARLFPHLITEIKNKKGKITKALNFKLLKQEFNHNIVNAKNKETYSFTWPGKQESIKLANTFTNKTLHPCVNESLNFNITENIYIEGDNLEVLKILQNSYLEKIKMIYIDPPYNTGKDFIYKDNFTQLKKDYLEQSKQKNIKTNSLITNIETNGRFHSNWLNMMYPRLKLARNLLKENGIIFISIDDNEVHNLRKICDEIFGDENFCGVIKRRAARKTAFLSKHMTDMCDYIVAYVRSNYTEPLIAGQVSDGTRPVFNHGNIISLRILRSDAIAKCNDGIYSIGKYLIRSLSFELLDELKILNGKVVNDVRILGQWRINQDVLDKTLFVTKNFGLRRTMMPEELTKNKLLNDLLDFSSCYNENGSEEILQIFGKSIFNNPKPRGLIEYLCSAASVCDNDIVLDFFAGSGTTGHAVLAQNAADGGSRKFILVQMAEECKKNSEAYKAGYKNIAEITKERIRRAGKNISEKIQKNTLTVAENDIKSENIKKLDIGFRVFKCENFNIENVYDKSHKINNKLFDININNHKTEEDLLFQVLLDKGLSLSLTIETKKVLGQKVFFVANNFLIACFNRQGKITEELIIELTKNNPEIAVFCDVGFENDIIKINILQLFNQLSPNTKIKLIG